MSLGLVSYGDSCSESEDESDNTNVQVILKKPLAAMHGVEDQIESIKIDDLINAELNFNLPKPKNDFSRIEECVEEDDEFLRKKAIPIDVEKPPPLPPSRIGQKKGSVKIILPALSEYEDDEKKKKPIIAPMQKSDKPCGLLNLLPKPKDSMFLKSNGSTTSCSNIKRLIPDSVSKPKPVASSKPTTVTSKTAKKPIVNAASDSDGSDAEDFFSLNAKESLPEVSTDEINQMVAKKTAKFTKHANSQMAPTPEAEPTVSNETQYIETPAIDEQAMQALCGSRAKRTKYEKVNVVDLSGDAVLPNRDEWLRNHLQATTEYQPKGMVDEEVAAGTKRKHQITYLAHQAKANEHELQAMWAANRHTRRQTQNKYGF